MKNSTREQLRSFNPRLAERLDEYERTSALAWFAVVISVGSIVLSLVSLHWLR